MSVIKKLVMKGFKSFAKRTEVPFGNKFNCVIGPNGSGKSTRYDTEVLLDSGEIKQIGLLVDEALANSKIHIQLDDGVYTPENPYSIRTWGLEPKSMKVVKKDISAFIKREGEPYLYEITTRTGKSVTTTGCHPVMIFKSNEVKSEIVRNLSTGNFIATPNKLIFPSKKVKLPTASYSFEGDENLILENSIRLPLFLNEEFGRFLGYLVGDGYIAKDARCDFINADKELINDFISISRKFGCIISLYKYKSKGKASVVSVYSKILTKYLINELFKQGYKKEKKHIPSILMFAEEKLLANFLAALFDCDASVRQDTPSFEYTTMSEKLANQVQLALLRFGIVAKKQAKLKYATNTKLKKRKFYYHITIYGKEQLEKLYKSIPFKCNHKLERLAFIANKKLKPNPNLDLIPKEANKLVRECAKLLCIGYKPLRKKHPRFAAYNEDRCCLTRGGIKEALGIFSTKIGLIKKSYSGLRLDQNSLMNTLRAIGLPTAKAAKAIGVTRHAITDFWEKNLFKAKPEHLKKFYDFIKIEIEEILERSGPLVNVLENLSNSDIFWDQIVGIKKVRGEPYVYDLTIPNCHNFIGNGIFVHNSNITDALCFVLGKSSARGMRAEKSANLIFNGGKNGTPAKDAEVSIVFDNSKKKFPIEAAEVEISRLVKQNGNSVYRINNDVRTRQQIIDLLNAAKINPDGHNIILQNDINMFMEMKTEERRELIEEVSGISIFEEKKRKALNELERVQEKINESEIILTERQKTLSDLKEDRDQALEYKELEKNIKRNKATSLHLKMSEREEKLNEINSRINKYDSEISPIQKQIEDLKQEIIAKREDIVKINDAIKDSGDRKQKEITTEIDQLKESLVRGQSRKDVCESELKKLEERKKQLEKDLNETKSKINVLDSNKKALFSKKEELKAEGSSINEKIAALKKRENLGSEGKLSEKLGEVENRFNGLQIKIAEQQQRMQETLRKKDYASLELESLRKKEAEEVSLQKENKEQALKLKELKTEFSEVAKSLAKNLNESTVIYSQLGDTRSRIIEANNSIARLKAHNMGIKELADVDAAIAKVKESKLDGIYGTVNELGQVNSSYAMALNIAAGPRIKSIVVSTDEVATKCIRLLKESKSGIATFLPLNKLKEKKMEDEAKKLCGTNGVIGLALDLITFKPKFADVFKYVFGSTLVVDNIETARKLGIGRARMVTIDGDLMETSGAMIGGYRKSTGVGFKEKERDADIQKLAEEIEMLNKKVNLLEDKKTKLEEEIIGQREKKAVLENNIKIFQEKLNINPETAGLAETALSKKEEIKGYEKGLEDIKYAIGTCNKELEALKEERNRLIEVLSKKSCSAIAQELNTLSDKRQESLAQILNVESEIKNIDNQTTLFSRENSKIAFIIQNGEKDTKLFIQEFEELKLKLEREKGGLKEKQKEQAQFYKEYKDMFMQRTKLDDQINKRQAQIASAEVRLKGIEDKKNNVVVDRAVLSGELEGLKKEFEQYPDVPLRRGIQIEALNSEIKSFEKMLVNMGNVNLRALEIYEKANEEYDKIKEKQEKLKLEKEDVLNMMYEIEGKKKASFMKTFNILEKKFTEIFSTLSEKGEAYLFIENPEDPFAAGVDIQVRIAYNKYLDIKSLSGGEETLAALAFIFAIQEFDPAPFYIMDEVDAALDKRNSELLSRLIAKYSEMAQYIVISHNDIVITEAELLYGVSMQESISRIVSLKV